MTEMTETQAMSSAPAIAFVGRSGCGKTTLLTKILAILQERGVAVGVVKHSPVHRVVTDVPGTDTHRFWQAGAKHVMLVAKDRVSQTVRLSDEPPLEAVLSDLVDVDLVLVEGYKGSSLPKVEMVRSAVDPQPMTGLESRVALVTDVPDLDLGCPRFGLAETVPIADFLIRTYLG
jgi:molybdopterin-guanine dinucleotide biosynthesis protein MobB